MIKMKRKNQVFRKYCALSLEFSKFGDLSLASSELLLVTENGRPIGVNVYSELLRGWVALKPAEDGLQWIGKNTFFLEHPVFNICWDMIKMVMLMLDGAVNQNNFDDYTRQIFFIVKLSNSSFHYFFFLSNPSIYSSFLSIKT